MGVFSLVGISCSKIGMVTCCELMFNLKGTNIYSLLKVIPDSNYWQHIINVVLKYPEIHGHNANGL